MEGSSRPTLQGHEDLSERWVGAGHLKEGDRLKLADGSLGTVLNVTTVQETREMFNLTAETAHTFYVGGQGWLVHNATACELRARRANTISKAGVRYDADGFPMFNSLHDFKLPASLQGPTISDGAQMRAATRDLRKALVNDPQLSTKLGLTEKQLKAIKGGKANIYRLTWHHHQDGVIRIPFN